ncbi:MAG: tryptophan-rich sensory protein [Gammaproteobacteria bacterium]|nr:tryptophan-rich sensory protein [Gammaproteobacteria bacterium]
MDRTVLPLVATLMVLIVNAAANIVPINGLSTGQLSSLYPTGFTPPGWVFSIWSVIYLGLLSFGVAAWRGGPRVCSRIAAIRNPYYLNAVGNAAWIFAWHYRQVELSVAIMLLILATLIVIFTRLQRLSQPSTGEYLCVDGVFAIYFGWITTATLVNLATLFFDRSWYPLGLSMDQWALATVCAAAAIYVWMGAVTRSPTYCAVFVWAASGVFLGDERITEGVRIAALTGAVSVTACLIWAIFSPRPRALFRGP